MLMEGDGWVLMVWEVTREREVQESVRQQERLAAVGRLAAGIAHDFNNILTAMMGTAQILGMREDTPGPIREDLQTILEQGHRAAHLVRQVLDFSRQTVVQRQEVDLVPFLKESLKLLERILPENIRIASELGNAEKMVNANLSQLQQVITNLAVNARDAMPEGGDLMVGLSDRRLEPDQEPPLPGMGPGEWVVWTVSDTGVGMPPEVVEHIYEPFFTTKEAGEGTGLGLAQVYGIVKQNDGFIDVESRVGEGTTFTIYLPRALEGTVVPVQVKAETPMGRGETILLVEDESGVRRVAIGMLEALGYRVLKARTGLEALSAYDAQGDEIDLVLSDMVMPEMGGVKLLEELRRRDPGAKLVLMSGYSPKLEEKGHWFKQADGFLDKPLEMEQMARVVSETLGADRNVRES